LGKLLDPEKPEAAALAARTLGRIGPAAGAAVPALLKCLEVKDANLKYQAVKALCYVAPSEAAARATVIDAVLANPWFMGFPGKTSYPPRLTSYRTLALSLLGAPALPQLLERASKIASAGLKKGTPEPPYAYICDLASAAFAIDPKSAPDFLPLLQKIPRTNPPKVGGGTLGATEQDLKGAKWALDPANLPVRGKAAKGKAAEDKPAKDKPPIEE
jgi:hypothetical protein